ncbi:MAG: NAD(P)/FAD-dependent oxidoreductase, partial [Candidatus Bathyarchaeota archaeon]
QLRERTLVMNAIYKDNFLVGVKAKDLKKNQLVEIQGKVIIDASGMVAVLRNKIPIQWHIEQRVQQDDLEACYQEIREISRQIHDPGFLKIHFSRTIAPGGYYWIFPKKNNRVNVGVGVQMKNSFPNPKDQLYKHVLSTPLFTNSKKIQAGMGLVPTRRAINLVGNGILFVGDAACQTNPTHGGGIGPSMLAGKLASETACKAIENDDVSQENLWSYNIEYTLRYGIKYAGLDIFRILLQKCRDENLNYGMANGFIKGEYIFSRATLYDDVVSKITTTSRHRPFFKTLIQTSEAMKRIKKMYEVFPQPEKYPAWIREVDEIIAEMKGLVLVNGDSKIDFTYQEKEERKTPFSQLSL